MRKYIISIFIFILPLFLNAQKNEITSFYGCRMIYEGEAFQLKYGRDLKKGFSIVAGIRRQSNIESRTYESGSELIEPSYTIQNAFNSWKIDLGFLMAPINKNQFKLKTGLGIDIGLSNYYEACWGVTIKPISSVDGYYNYRRYAINKATDLGMHFILQGNYYFNNQLFISAQALYNQMLNEVESNPEKYSITLYRRPILNLSIGIGYRF